MDQILMFSLFSCFLLVLFLSCFFILTLGSFNAEMATLGFSSVPRSLKGPHVQDAWNIPLGRRVLVIPTVATGQQSPIFPQARSSSKQDSVMMSLLLTVL